MVSSGVSRLPAPQSAVFLTVIVANASPSIRGRRAVAAAVLDFYRAAERSEVRWK
jgi:hypothetical protein